MNTKLSVFCDKVIEAGWLAAIVSVPLFFNIYSARTFEPDKITLLRSIVSLMVLAWIVAVVERGRVGGSETQLPLADRWRNWLKVPLFWPTALLVLVYLISTLFSISPWVGLWGSYQRMQGTYSMLTYIVLFALIAGNLRTREQVDRLVTTLIIASIPVSLYGIIQRYGLDPLPWAGDVTVRVASNMGNAIFVASYLIMVTPLTIARLIESMTAIIKEEKASWGHTILAAIYIFAIAVQLITVVFSQSRGPMLGFLGTAFVMGLVVVLALRQLDENKATLSLSEVGTGLLFVVPLGIATGLGGALGFLVGFLLNGLLSTLNYNATQVPLLAAVIGAALGFFGAYTYMAAAGRGWRWLWLSWIGVAGAAIVVLLALNIRGTSLDPYLDPVRQLPGLDRLSLVTETSRTGRVRVLIWDAAMELLAPTAQLGVPGDPLAPPDRFSVMRPLIGYGPESMFNAFAYVYPPELAHVEQRGSSADRSHNETMDSLVITGVLGFLAFYAVMVSVFYYSAVWLGWAMTPLARRGLLALLIGGGLLGAGVAYGAQGALTFTPLGLPFGLIAGLVIYLIWRGLVDRSGLNDGRQFHLSHNLLLIGLLGAIVGHFIEVHFVFSIAATYTYFWAYLGLMFAVAKIRDAELPEPVVEPTEAEPSLEPQVEPEETAAKRSKKSRARRGKTGRALAAQTAAGRLHQPLRPESWEIWAGSLGLAMAIILIILTFDFVTPNFEFSFSNESSASLIWMLVITWLVGFGLSISTVAVRSGEWSKPVSWGRAVALYAVTSLSYFAIYWLAHRTQLSQRVAVSSLDDIVRASSVVANGLVVFYIFLLALTLLIALTLIWGRTGALPAWRKDNWWLYPPLVAAMVTVVWFKNINVARADIFLKEGERYRNQQQWDQAITLHEKAISLDSDEDFYYLMLALDYQLMAQDSRMDQAQRQAAWERGEEIALQARAINPYNPDNTGNMGRYYFTLGQILNQDYFQKALDYFERATVLAPSNVIYHNLWAQTYYILGNYEAAIDRLKISASIDPNYSPTWLLLGDTYAAQGEVEEALAAHTRAIGLNSGGSGDGFAGFADQSLDRRLNFYISAGQGEAIIKAIEQAGQNRPADARIPATVGRAYNLMGQTDQALESFEQARQQGDNSASVLRETANIYFNQKNYEQAVPLFELILESNPTDVETHSALAFMYAQQGRLDDAIGHNQQVLEQLPNDYDTLKNLALLYQQQGNLQAAFEAAQQAQAVAPEAEQASWEQFIADLEAKIAGSS